MEIASKLLLTIGGGGLWIWTCHYPLLSFIVDILNYYLLSVPKFSIIIIYYIHYIIFHILHMDFLYPPISNKKSSSSSRSTIHPPFRSYRSAPQVTDSTQSRWTWEEAGAAARWTGGWVSRWVAWVVGRSAMKVGFSMGKWSINPQGDAPPVIS